VKVRLAQPITVGTIYNQITVKEMEIASVSFNFEPELKKRGKAILSVVLVDPATGWKHNIVIRDATALNVWQAVDKNNNISRRLLTQILGEGRLPAGEIFENPDSG